MVRKRNKIPRIGITLSFFISLVCNIVLLILLVSLNNTYNKLTVRCNELEEQYYLQGIEWQDNEVTPILYQTLVVTQSFIIEERNGDTGFKVLYEKEDIIYLLSVDTLGGTKCWGISPFRNGTNEHGYLIIDFIESSNFNKARILTNHYRLP